ncbi:MAG TPA: choice-of-anchor D domain-containing protein [Conexibacter sp.]|nr:choice-of-anchor D domain-containing protein [Conexibacter sp.]
MTHRTGRACALALGLLLTAGVATASAGTATTTFSATGAEQTYTVPAGVTRLDVVITGGHGGVPGNGAGGTPGRAARITGTLAVVPGQTVYVEVGGVGGTGCGAAFNGGGLVGCGSGWSGQGGGASDIRTISNVHGSQSLLSRLLVAGGGGGAGYGANGGDAGLDAEAQDGATNGSDGGRGATPAGGGAGGALNGACSFGTSGGDGALGSGGGAGDFHSGSGGGGWYGGGGGGGWTIFCSGPAAGGGGGGSSYIVPGASGTITLAALVDVPTVAISVDTPEADANVSTLTFGSQRSGSVSAPQAVTVTNVGDAPLHVAGMTFSGAGADDFLLGSDDCRGAVAVGQSCTIQVRFAPQALGARSATLDVASDADGGPLQVSLDGEGVEGAAGPQGAQGAAGPQGPQGAAGPQGPAGRNVDALRCIRTGARRGVRTFLCHVVGARLPKAGTSVRLRRGGRTIAAGSVARNERLLLRTKRSWLTDGGTLVFGDGRLVVRLG